MASSSVGVGGGLKLMRARGLLVFSEMMALLLICLVMMSSSVNTCQGRLKKNQGNFVFAGLDPLAMAERNGC
uniref:Uncharacterized protein n=1 Tax=Oryza barthii TaxID=65489 RepID=A0A0D3FS43_9ORYZ